MTSSEVVDNLHTGRKHKGNCIGIIFRKIYTPNANGRLGCRYYHPTIRECCGELCGKESSEERVKRGITRSNR
jgi:hypothetical protein